MQILGSDKNKELFGTSTSDVMIAKEGDDILHGWDGDNAWLDGVDGDNTLLGGAGEDKLSGGRENDWIHGDLGRDQEWQKDENGIHVTQIRLMKMLLARMRLKHRS